MKSQSKFIHFLQENAFENVVWKMAAILSRPQCVKPNFCQGPTGHHPVNPAPSLCHEVSSLPWTRQSWRDFPRRLVHSHPIYRDPAETSLAPSFDTDVQLRRWHASQQNIWKQNIRHYQKETPDNQIFQSGTFSFHRSCHQKSGILILYTYQLTQPCLSIHSRKMAF